MSLSASYLDYLDARLEKQGGRGSLARLLLVARRGEAGDDPDAVVRYHERVRLYVLNFTKMVKVLVLPRHRLVWMLFVITSGALESEAVGSRQSIADSFCLLYWFTLCESTTPPRIHKKRWTSRCQCAPPCSGTHHVLSRFLKSETLTITISKAVTSCYFRP